jgi:hypothetical protein
VIDNDFAIQRLSDCVVEIYLVKADKECLIFTLTAL